MSGTIFAYTGPTGPGYPAYVNITRLENGDVRVSVRGEPRMLPTADQSSMYAADGPLAFCVVPAAEWPFPEPQP